MRWAFFVIASLVLFVPARVFAFACSKACALGADPCPMLTQVWQTRCIPFAVNPHSVLLGTEARHRLVAESFAVWSSNACSDVIFKDEGDSDQLEHFSATEPPSDQRNVVGAVENRDQLPMFFDDPGLLAVTLTHFSVATGEILDADILLNAVSFHFDEVSDPRGACLLQPMTFDLRNTLVHEMGHFIGFDHVLDQQATMFASAEPCEVSKRDLAQDDKNAICTVYPAGMPARTCLPSPNYNPSNAISGAPYRLACDRAAQMKNVASAGGCSCATGEQRSSGAAILMLFVAAAIGRRTSRPLRRS